MIDISHERLLTFGEACKTLPRRRREKKTGRKKKTATSTIWRWANHGLRGVKLETIVIGGQRMTSAEALQRFFDRLTDSPSEMTVEAGAQRRRKSRAEVAGRELQQAGI